MDERGYKDNIRNIILDMLQKELDSYVSHKGIQKYFDGNVDKIIIENIQKFKQGTGINRNYLRILKKGSEKDSIGSIARLIKSEEVFRNKNELIKLARYLGIQINKKHSYNQILRRVSSHIYSNRNEYSKKYVFYKRGEEEYILEPEKMKVELVESYRSKATNDMRSIAKLLNVKVDEEENAEDIRRKVINHIIKEKISKK